MHWWRWCWWMALGFRSEGMAYVPKPGWIPQNSPVGGEFGRKPANERVFATGFALKDFPEPDIIQVYGIAETQSNQHVVDIAFCCALPGGVPQPESQ